MNVPTCPAKFTQEWLGEVCECYCQSLDLIYLEGDEEKMVRILSECTEYIYLSDVCY